MTMTEKQRLSIGESMNAKAIALAIKADTNKELEVSVTEQMQAKEVSDTGAVRLLLQLRETFDLSDFPVPGSKIEDMSDGFNGLVDHYKVTQTNENTGNKSTPNQSFFVTFADHTRLGEAIVQELKWLTILGDKEKDASLVDKDFAKEYGSNPIARKERVKYLTGRRGTIRTAYRKAVSLWYKMDAINEMGNPDNGGDVRCYFIYADKEKTKIKQTSFPIRIQSISNIGEWNDYRVSSVLRMDVDKATKNGRSFTALEDTLKREKKDGAASSKSKPQEIKTLDTFEARITDLHDALKETWSTGSNKKLRTEVFAKMLSDKGDDMLLSLYDINNTLTEWLNSKAIETKIEGLLEKKKNAA